MSEAPQPGTSNLSIAGAVESLLAENAPVEDTVDPQEVVAETEEVEVEAAEETEEAEDILQADEAEEDETEAAEEAEEVVEAVEPQTYRVRVGDDEVDLTLDELQSG